MKKKGTSVITLFMAASLIFSASGAAVLASEVEDEESVEEDSKNESEEPLEWTTEQIADLSDILTGVEDKEYTAGTASKYDIHMGVNFDKDIVRGVLFKTADVNCATPGEYEVTYLVYFNRDALLDYMDENDMDVEDFTDLSDASSERIEVIVNGKVVIDAAYEEPAYEEPAYEESVYEEPVYEEPVYEEPVYEEPVYEEPVYEEPVYEEPVYEEPVYEEPVYEEPVQEESSSGGTYVQNVDDCDGSGHGYTGLFDSNGNLIEVLGEY